MDEKVLGILGTLGCIILGVVAAAVAWFCGGSELQTPAKEVLRRMFNFEITIVILGVILMFIPVVGQLIALALSAVNLIYAVMAFLAIQNNKEFKAPAYEFIK